MHSDAELVGFDNETHVPRNTATLAAFETVLAILEISVVMDAVQSEPVSALFSLLTGKTGKNRNFWLNLGVFGDFCAISVCVYSELGGASLLI